MYLALPDVLAEDILTIELTSYVTSVLQFKLTTQQPLNASTAQLTQLAAHSTKMDSSPFAVADLDTPSIQMAKFAITVLLEPTGIHSSLNVPLAQALLPAAHTKLTEL